MKLCKELHISFLDQKLYDKYILAERTSSNLYKLCLLTTELLEHKSRTVTVLQLIQRREVLSCCKRKGTAPLWSKGEVSVGLDPSTPRPPDLPTNANGGEGTFNWAHVTLHSGRGPNMAGAM